MQGLTVGSVEFDALVQRLLVGLRQRSLLVERLCELPLPEFP